MNPATELASLDFLPYRPSEVLDLRYNASLDYLLVLRANNQVQVIRRTNFQPLRTIGLNRKLTPLKVLWAHDDKIIVVTADSLVLVYALDNALTPVTTITAAAPGLWNASYTCGSFGEDLMAEVLSLAGDDGTIAIYVNSVEEGLGGQLTVDFRLSATVNNFGDPSARCLACEVALDARAVFASYSNGTVKRYQIGGANPTVWSCTVKKDAALWTLKAFNADFVIVGGQDRSVSVIDTQFGAIVQTFSLSAADVTAIAVDPSRNRFFVSGLDSRVFLIGFEPEERQFSLLARTRGQTHEVNALELLAKENLLVSAGKTSDLCLYGLSPAGFTESEEAKKRHELEDPGRFVFHSRGGILGYYLGDRAVLLRVNAQPIAPTANGPAPNQVEALFEYRSDKYLNACVYCPKHGVFACSVPEERAVKLFRTDNGKTVRTLEVVAAGLVVRDDNLLIFDAEAGHVRVFKLSQNAFSSPIKAAALESLGGYLDHFELSQTKNLLLLANLERRKLLVVRLATGEVTDASSLLAKTLPHTLAFFGNTERLFILSPSYHVSVYLPAKEATYKARLTDLIPKKMGNVRGVVFHPTSKDRLLLYSSFFIARVDLAEDKVELIRRARPLVYLGRLAEGRLLGLTIDWGRLRKELGNPINTKRFLK